MNKHIENTIKNKVSDKSYELDLDKMWAGVQPHIPAQKRRRSFVFFWLFGFLAVVATMLLFRPRNVESVKMDFQSDQKVELTPTATPNLTKSLETIDISSENSSTEKMRVTDPLHSDLSDSELVFAESSNTIGFSNSNHGKYLMTPAFEEEGQFKDEEDFSRQEVPVSKELFYLPTIDDLRNDRLVYNRKMRSPRLNVRPYIQEETLNSRNTTVGISGSYGINFGTYKTSNPNFEKELQQRKSTEISMDNWSLGLEIGKRMSSRFGISLGLSFSQYWEKNELTNVTTETISKYMPTAYVYSSGGIDTLWGNTNFTRTRTSNEKIYLRYSSWQVPIRLNYFGQLSNYEYYLGTGIDLRFSPTYKGRFYHESAIYNMEADEDRLMNYGLQYNLTFAAGIQKMMNSALGLRLGLSGRIPLSSYSSSDYDIDHWIYSINLESSLFYKF
ncbi:MAG: hypothetical protein R2766_07565 [Saprospiraceae bacterium]